MRGGGRGVAGLWGAGGWVASNPDSHGKKQLKNRQSNRETTLSPGRKRQKLKNRKVGGGGGGKVVVGGRRVGEGGGRNSKVR